jgi:hypothetical protein
MNYPALSDMWRLNMATNGKANGQGVTQTVQSRILFRTKQVFPITLFPSQLVVEELRIICIKQMGPWTSEILSIMATDIASVNASSGLFLGLVHIKSLTGGPEILINSLPRHDVYKVRSLVEGIAMSAREGLKVSGDTLEAERQNLYQAGKVN